MNGNGAKTFYDIIRRSPKGRWSHYKRNHTVEDVLKLRGSVTIEHTLATLGANKLWQILLTEPYIHVLGAQTPLQAMQYVRAGLKGIYLSGWQVAGDANVAGKVYPDQSLYPANSGPELCRRINNALLRADQIECSEGTGAQRDWFRPIVADAEAGFGGSLNCYELMKAYIEAGAAGVHFEDQLGSEKKCGHMGGKVLIPTSEAINHLNAARLAADVESVPTVLIARTDAESATLLTTDIDERDHEFIDYEAGRTPEGFFRLKAGMGLQHCIKRGKNLAPYSDLLWMETSKPDLGIAKAFAEGVQEAYPSGLKLAYNCSPSFNWAANLSASDIARFQRELGAMGYKFQFITLAGWHLNNFGAFDLARQYRDDGMTAYVGLQQKEFGAAPVGYTGVKHQREVGTGYFDAVQTAITQGKTSVAALKGSTEEEQFQAAREEEAGKSLEFEKLHMKVTMPTMRGDEEILTSEAMRFLCELHEQFEDRRQKLLEKRIERQYRLDEGSEMPDFDPKTKDIRQGDWKVAEVPADLQDRRVEITGPVDRKMVINALNSGANCYMADLEDSSTPTWRNMIDAQINLRDANKGQISYVYQTSVERKEYVLGDNPALLLVRPRGWHLPEKHVMINGRPMSGSLFDFGLYLFHNGRTLNNQHKGAYMYLPKLQNAEEAQLWADVFAFAQQKLDLPKQFVKCTVLIEHVLAAFQMDEIMYALKDHLVGLNCGRWDYIFSYIKTFRHHGQYVTPDRQMITMMTPFMRAYSLLTIKNCHRRGAHAMGGMAAQIPIKGNEQANHKALMAVRQDKEREVNDGHDGTWVAHPGLVPLAKEVFDEMMKTPNQVNKLLPDYNPTAKDLLEIPTGVRTEAGLRHSINVTLGYMESWLRGTGCVPLYNLMEDAATAEISRAQLWQWVRHGAQLEDGTKVNSALIDKVIAEEVERWQAEMPHANRFGTASDLIMELTYADEMPEFLTLRAYDTIVDEGH